MSDMTATRIGSPVRLLTLAVLAGVWAVAAYLLWTRTVVPDGLHLGGVHERDLFGDTFIDRAEHYERFFYWLVLGQTVLTLVVFALYAWRGDGFTRESAAGPIGTAMLLAMLGFALVWLVTVPFEVLSLWWQRRHDQSHESYGEVIFGNWFLLGFQFLLLAVAVLIVVGLARLLPRLWWIPAAAAFIGLQILLAFTFPYLVPDTRKLQDPELRAAAARIAEEQGVHGVPIREQKVDTEDPNAFTAGLGPSRKVFIWSSMLTGEFSNEELKVVIAHEYGHQARRHIWKGIAWYALFTVPLAYLIAVVARRRGGMRDPRAMPLALLVFVVFNLVATPFHAAISRHMEAEADWMALRTTRDPDSMETLFRGFARHGLHDPSPPTVPYLFFEDHPTAVQRVAMAREWARLQRRPARPPAGS